ncbi:MAG TPA: hypothetical protein VKV57_15450 [bacterium]|nr:hypothetical protein [bacterium]
MAATCAKSLLCILVLLLTLPAAAGTDPTEYQFLWSDGAYLHRVALNGATVASGAAISISLPLYISKYLVDGHNELEVEYTSDSRVGLTVAVETRAKEPRRVEVARFHSPPGESRGASVVKTLAFTVHVHPQPPLHLTDADREAILAVLQSYYATLVRRDGAGLGKLYAKAMEEDAPIYPEGIGVFQWVLGDSQRMLAAPQFHMKPFQRTGLLFSIAGQVVVVTKPDGTPVVESDAGEPGDGAQAGFNPESVAFEKYDGRWYLALPFGF